MNRKPESPLVKPTVPMFDKFVHALHRLIVWLLSHPLPEAAKPLAVKGKTAY